MIHVWAKLNLIKWKRPFASILGTQLMSRLFFAAHQDALGPTGRFAGQLSHRNYRLPLCCPAANESRHYRLKANLEGCKD